MANNSISVDSNELETIISNVNSDKTSIGEVNTSFESSFKPLTDVGLFVDCLNNLKEESKNIETAYEVLIRELNSHLDDYNSLENQLAQVANNYRSYYSPTTGGGVGSYTSGNPNTVTDVNDGTPIDPEKMETKIEKIDFNAIDEMLNFISITKDSDKTIGDILADANNANYFCTLLQNYYKTYNSTLVEYDSSSSVQQLLLRQLLNSDVDNIPKALSDKSIIKYKKYLHKIAKDNNTTVYDLSTKEQFKEIFKDSLLKLYNKEINSTEFDDNYCNDFRTFIDSRAKEKNVDKDKLFEDIKLLL